MTSDSAPESHPVTSRSEIHRDLVAAGVPDTRSLITPDAFSVAPELLGLPLAGPWRRMAAIAIDGILVAILANAKTVLFGVALALVFFRVSAKRGEMGFIRRSIRLSFRAAGALVLFIVALATWDWVADLGDEDEVDVASSEGAEGIAASAATAVPVIGGVIAFRTADNEQEAREAAEQFARSLRAAGLDDDEVHEALRGLAEGDDQPWMAAAAESVAAGLAEPSQRSAAEETPPDTLAVRYAEAVVAGDTAAAAALRPRIVAGFAADTLIALLQSVEQEQARSRALQEDLQGVNAELEEAEQGPGILALFRNLADDLGLGLGWASLYFTAFLALWQGQTPGKRLLGLRVVRLSGKPMTWWSAFTRFGGYAAGFATGLLGFAQVLWDWNRQGVHDKISETVVIETRGEAR